MKDIVVVAWNGQDEPLKFIQFDCVPNFMILIFNYSGNANSADNLLINKKYDLSINEKTEFKGQLLYHLAKKIQKIDYRYVGILDDDQEITVSGINELLKIAENYNADSFQPSISEDSYHSHSCFVNNKEKEFEEVSWIEIMAPFMRKVIFEAGLEFYRSNISSYGIDLYVFPFIQRKLNLDKKLLIHKVVMRHTKKVTTGFKVHSNGLDSIQECEITRKLVLELIKKEGVRFSKNEIKELFGRDFFRIEKIKNDIIRILRDYL